MVRKEQESGGPGSHAGRFFAACTLGLESALAAELEELGAEAVRPARGGVRFRGDLTLGEKACLWLRTATRVQQQLARGEVRDRDQLLAFVGWQDWSRWMDVDQTLAVDATIKDSFATDPRFVALVVKDAVVDQWRSRTGRRPNVDRHAPQLPLKLVLRRTEALLYRDLSGASLHKRGYRPIQVKSPLNEALAAGLLRLAEWDRETPLLDPMCGSGTLVIEAALWAGDRAPGLERRFPFVDWPDHRPEVWQALKEEARARAEAGQRRIPALEAADRHGGSLALARQSAAAAGVADYIVFTQADVRDLVPDVRPEFLITNPPYGERIGRGEDLGESWHRLGTFLHERCAGARAFVLSGNPELPRLLRLKVSKKWPVQNGPIDCRLLRYDLRP